MKSKRLLLTLLMALLVPWAAMAQTSLRDYTFSYDVTTFSSIVSTGTKLTFSDVDDGYATVTLPFALPYGESSIAAEAKIACSANGFMYLGATSTSGTTGSYSSTTYRAVNAFLQQDGHIGRYTSDDPSGAWYLYDETAGTLTIEYHRLGAYYSPYGSYTYQVVFHSNGDIEFIYGVIDHGTATSRTMATYLTDGPKSDFVYVTGAWAEPTKSTTYATRPFSPVPVEGLRYTFTRPVIAYPKPGNFHITGSDHESVSLAWTAPEQGPNTLTGYAYQYKKASDTDWPTSWTNDIDASATTLTIHELNASTSYNFRLKALYGSNESDIVTTDGATTAQATAVGDQWSDDFEGDACGWELINGTITNANWVWGTAVNNGGTHSIYISNDGGTTNSYNASGYARVYATKLLSFADSKYTFTFDWKCVGEVGSTGTSYDYLSVGLLPATVQLSADNNSDKTLPDGWIALHDASYLAAQTEWQTAPEKPIQVVAGNYYLVLRWRQDNSTSYGVPAAVDNISITRVTCPYDVTGLVVATDPAVTAHTATINWTAGEATQWQIAWSKDSNFASSETAIVSSPTKALEDLDASSTYYVKVRAYCGGNDYGTWSGYIYFDTPATCIQPTWPTEGAVANISTDEATLTWIAGSTEQDHWDIYYSTSSVAPTTETVLDETNSIQNTSTNPYTLTGLTSASDYYVWVRGNCGNGDFSAWSAMASFQTNCDAYTLPYDYDFETAAKMKCWTMNNCSSSTGRYSGYGYNSSSYSFRFYYSYSYTPQYLISPELIGTTSGVRVEFYYRGNWNSSTQKFMVGYSTTDNAVESFTWDDEISFTSSTYTLFTNDYPAGTKYVAIKYTTTSSDYMYIDNIRLTASPTCREPKLLTCDSKTAHTATLSWTNGTVDQNAWQIVYSTQYDFDPDAATPADVTSNPVTIEGLTHNTTYYAYVRANCGNGDYSAWSNKCTFSTLNATVAPSTPYEVDGTLTYNSITIGWNAVAGNDHHSSYELYYSTDIFMPDVLIQDNLITGITETTYPLTGLTEETSYYVWVRDNCGDDGISPWSSRFSFDTPEVCPAPVLNNPTNITAHGATFSWTGSYDSYNVMYSSPAHIQGFSEQFDLSSLPTGWTKYNTLLTDDVLNGNTALTTDNSTANNYATWRSTNTSALGQYNWAKNLYGDDVKHWMVTPSVEVKAGYSLSFDVALTGYNNDYAPTYSSGDDVRFVVLISENNKATWSILREWNNTSSDLVLNNISETGDKISIDLSSFVNKTVNVAFYCEQTVANNDADNDLHIDNVAIGIAVPATAWAVAAANVEGNSVTVDDRTIFESSTPYEVKVVATCNIVNPAVEVESNVKTFTTDIACPAPTALTVSNVKSTSAKLSWNNDASAWQICVNDDMDNLINVTENPYTLQGLTPEIEYTVKVRANCEAAFTGDGFSKWTDAEVFTTLSQCVAPYQLTATNLTSSSADLSWDGEQQSYNVSYRKVITPAVVSNVTYDFNDGTMQGWTTIDADGYGDAWSINNNCMRATYNSDYDHQDYLVSPEIQLGGSLSFYAKREDSEYDDTFRVYLSLSGNSNASDFTIELTNGDVLPDIYYPTNPYTYDLSNYSGTGYVAIVYTAENDQYYLYVDNITISNTTPAVYDEWVNRNNVTSPLTIDNLEVYTMYEWQVQGVNCDGNGTATEWSETKSFKTPYSLDIEGYGDLANTNGWYLIASPVATAITPTVENGFLANEYDLYYFQQNTAETEWMNYEAGAFDIVSGKGYLYANEQDVTLRFAGELYTGNGEFDLDYVDGTRFAGWNLVGNPFTTTATVNMDYYRMNNDRNDIVAGSGAVAPMEGVFVKATEAGQKVTFSQGTSAPTANPSFALNLTKNRGNVIDRAIVRFGNSNMLPKFQLFENSTKLAIAQEGKEYAVVSAEATGEMPVNFKANKDGEYTLSFTSQEVSFSYLHLIDNMTGADVDLLANPSYSFNALTTDYASRFRLVFATGSSIDGDSFGFINGAGNLNIFGIEGEATVQVIDVLGHVISSDTFSGSYERKLNVAPGVYMIRLIQGNDVKVQKMVVR